MRVNLDMSKSFYSYSIQQDKEIEGTTARSTTIPEELGRISYLLSDKTGTLTQNEMVFKKLHLETLSYGTDSFHEVRTKIFYSKNLFDTCFIKNFICSQDKNVAEASLR